MAGQLPLPSELEQISIDAYTDNLTLVLTNSSRVVELTAATAKTITVPPNSSVAFPIGTVIEICRMGAGTVTVVQGSGVTVRSPGSMLALRAQYSSASLRKRATDEWVLSGDLS